jgi:hypothetical protein
MKACVVVVFKSGVVEDELESVFYCWDKEIAEQLLKLFGLAGVVAAVYPLHFVEVGDVLRGIDYYDN